LVSTPSVIADGGLTGVTFNADGTANIPVGTNSGTYTLRYEICLEADNAICDQADVVITIPQTIPDCPEVIGLPVQLEIKGAN